VSDLVGPALELRTSRPRAHVTWALLC